MHLVPESFGPMGDHMAGAIRIDAARAATIAHDPLDRRLMGALSEHDTASRFDDGSLLPRDGFKGVAENAHVVETDARNGDRDRVGCARGVPATAHSDLEHCNINARLGEHDHRGDRQQVERGDGVRFLATL